MIFAIACAAGLVLSALFGVTLVGWLVFAEAFVAVRRLLGRDS